MKPTFIIRATKVARALGRDVASEFLSAVTLRLAIEAGAQLRDRLGRVSTLEQLEQLRTMLTPQAWALVVDLYDVLRTHAGMSPISYRRSPIH